MLLGLRSLRKLVKKEEKRRKRMFMLRRVGQGDGAPQGEERPLGHPNYEFQAYRFMTRALVGEIPIIFGLFGNGWSWDLMA